MRKKIACLLLAAVLVAALTACSGDTASPEADSGQPGVSTQGSDDVVELVFWEMMWGKSDRYPATVQKLVDQFNEEHPGINVTVQMVAWDNFYQDFLTAVTSQAAPDISTGGFSQSVQYAAMNEILDLSSIVEEWESSGFIDNFPEGSIELHQYGDIQAGIPWITDPRVITYRKDILDGAGVTDLPTTWDEMLDACAKIKAAYPDMTPLVIPGDRDGWQIFLSMMFENNTGITDAAGNPNIDSPEFREVLDYIRVLYDNGYISSSTASYTDSDMDSMLLSGNAAICYGALRTTVYGSGDPIADTLATMPAISSQPGGTPRTLMWVNPIVAYSQTDHPEECKIFIKWWIENMLPLFTEGGINGYPAVRSMMEDSYYASEPYVGAETVTNVIPYGTVPVWPTPSLYTAWSVIEGENYLGMALQEVVTGNTDNDAIVQRIGGLVEQAFDDAA